MSTAFHAETDGLSEDLNKPVVCYVLRFATQNQANRDYHHPLADNALNSSVQHSTKQMPIELDLCYKQPLPLDLIAALQRRQPTQSVIPLESHEFVQRLQRIFEVAKNE
jgi:hypothetical protein